MKRWMAVAALGLAAAGGIVTPGAARASSSIWYQVYQSRYSGNFLGIAAISTSNIWAVGDTYTSAGNTIYTPFIRHYNGSSWQTLTIPGATTSASDWVSASAANNVWVGGLKNTSAATTVVYRWNGARWGKVPVPALTDLQGVVVLAPNNAWAYASGAVVHWNGSTWKYYLLDSDRFIAQGLSASAANNVWASGVIYSGSNQVAVAYRWNGSAWHSASMPHPVVYDRDIGVTAVSPSDVWIGYHTTTSKYALHWDGSHWHTVTVPFYALATDIVPDGKGGYWFGSQAILTGSTWTGEQVPSFSGDEGSPTRIPGTTSFLMNAAVMTGSSSTEKPTIFRFDL